MKNFIMHTKIFILLLFCLASIVLSCNKEALVSTPAVQSDQSSTTGKAGGAAQASGDVMGATQISGVGFFDATDACNSVDQGATFALTLTGDLEGCDYFFIDEFECSPSGTYREEGRELFVGTYNGQSGTFRTTYKFEGKYEGCAENGAALGLEIFGRCQHPIVAGSGTGVFSGVSGRLDFKDDIEVGNFPYRGHLKF